MIEAGEIRTIFLDDQPREVEVVADTDSPGWWRCRDV
jgi:hypothetical protein